MAVPSDISAAAPAAPNRLEQLTLTLRAVAARAAEQVSGTALVFSHGAIEPPGYSAPPLRAAAGFASAEDAREAASTVAALVRECQETASTRSATVAGRGAAVAFPIRMDDRIWGALVTFGAQEPAEPVQGAIRSLAETAALRADHVYLSSHVQALEEKLSAHGAAPAAAEAHGDELLKLSEALFAQDIELLRSSEKLSSIEKLKSDFIEKMSRELRTPLNGIIEAIISVLAGENETLSETAKANLRCALDDGTAFQRTLQNILDLWRIKQGELPIEVQDVNFREVVEEAIFSVQDTIGERAVAVKKHFEEPLPNIRTDLAKINQVLFLLLDNACKFTPQGQVDIRTRVHGGALRCEIIDGGIGICPDDRDFVFDEFFQVDPTTASTYKGAGLGLTLVRDLLTLMDGEIEIDSEVGRGTRVVFTVPVQPLA